MRLAAARFTINNCPSASRVMCRGRLRVGREGHPSYRREPNDTSRAASTAEEAPEARGRPADRLRGRHGALQPALHGQHLHGEHQHVRAHALVLIRGLLDHLHRSQRLPAHVQRHCGAHPERHRDRGRRRSDGGSPIWTASTSPSRARPTPASSPAPSRVATRSRPPAWPTRSPRACPRLRSAS